MGVFNDLVSRAVAKYGKDLEPGDVLVSNDPFGGMTHLPDVAVVVPVFWQGELVAFCASYSHHSDPGGRFPGGISSRSQTIYEEGIRLPLVRIVSRGRRNDDLLNVVTANVRAGDEWIADLDCKLAGCDRGREGVEELLQRRGLAALRRVSEHLVEHSERMLRAAIRTLPEGEYSHEEVLEDDGATENGVIKIRVRLVVSGDEISADLTGSSPQVASALNCPVIMVTTGVCAAIKAVIGKDIPVNAGFFRPIRVLVPAGTVVNPVFPAAVGGRTTVFFRVVDAAFRALAKATPGNVGVPGEGGHALTYSGQSTPAGEFVVMDLFCGGWGGRPTKDGIDGVHPVHQGSAGAIPVEVLERQFPVVVDGFGFVPDSGGAGRFRGSVAVFRQWRFLSRGFVVLRTQRLSPAEGLEGGLAGAVSVTYLGQHGRALEPVNKQTKTDIHLDVQPGDVVFHSTAGAGGHGDPLKRSPEAVLDDVRDEKVTTEGARTEYGVVVNADAVVIDLEATAALRENRRRGNKQ
jgi:N-methylhydantoinase B